MPSTRQTRSKTKKAVVQESVVVAGNILSSNNSETDSDEEYDSEDEEEMMTLGGGDDEMIVEGEYFDQLDPRWPGSMTSQINAGVTQLYLKYEVPNARLSGPSLLQEVQSGGRRAGSAQEQAESNAAYHKTLLASRQFITNHVKLEAIPPWKKSSPKSFKNGRLIVIAPPETLSLKMVNLSDWAPGENAGNTSMSGKAWKATGVNQDGTSFIDIAPNSFSKTESGKQPHLRAYDKEGIVELIRQTGLIVTLPIERGTPIHVHGLDAYKVLSRCEKIVLERLPVYSHYRTTRMYETTSRHLHRVPVYHAHVKDEDPRKGTLLVVSFAPCKFAMFMGSHLDIARQELNLSFIAFLTPSLHYPQQNDYYEDKFWNCSAPSSRGFFRGSSVNIAATEEEEGGVPMSDEQLSNDHPDALAIIQGYRDSPRLSVVLAAALAAPDWRIPPSLKCSEIQVVKYLMSDQGARTERENNLLRKKSPDELSREEAAQLEPYDKSNARNAAFRAKCKDEDPVMYEDMRVRKYERAKDSKSRRRAQDPVAFEAHHQAKLEEQRQNAAIFRSEQPEQHRSKLDAVNEQKRQNAAIFRSERPEQHRQNLDVINEQYRSEQAEFRAGELARTEEKRLAALEELRICDPQAYETAVMKEKTRLEKNRKATQKRHEKVAEEQVALAQVRLRDEEARATAASMNPETTSNPTLVQHPVPSLPSAFPLANAASPGLESNPLSQLPPLPNYASLPGYCHQSPSHLYPPHYDYAQPSPDSFIRTLPPAHPLNFSATSGHYHDPNLPSYRHELPTPHYKSHPLSASRPFDNKATLSSIFASPVFTPSQLPAYELGLPPPYSPPETRRSLDVASDEDAFLSFCRILGNIFDTPTVSSPTIARVTRVPGYPLIKTRKRRLSDPVSTSFDPAQPLLKRSRIVKKLESPTFDPSLVIDHSHRWL